MAAKTATRTRCRRSETAPVSNSTPDSPDERRLESPGGTASPQDRIPKCAREVTHRLYGSSCLHQGKTLLEAFNRTCAAPFALDYHRIFQQDVHEPVWGGPFDASGATRVASSLARDVGPAHRRASSGTQKR